jgi:EmrB/QacA subfamily drug resistance transporter
MDSAVRLGTTRGRALLTAMVLGSGMAFLDSTVVNVALPTIGRDLDADLAALQWTVNAYTLTLASLILLGGSLGDRLGRRRIFIVGVGWFTAASVLCALAPNVGVLIAARALQGIGGALLTPGSLAILQTSLHPDDRARAIGAWAGLTGMSGIVGPLLGGWLLEFDWRWVFGINVPIAAVTIWLALTSAPESRNERRTSGFDVPGAALGALALGAATYALVAAADEGLTAVVGGAAAVAVVASVAFVAREKSADDPMVPLSLFSSRTFTVINLVTFTVYAGLSGVMFFLVIQLQISLGWSPLEAGMASLPSTLIMLFLSGRSADIGARTGVRAPLTSGAALGAVGVALLAGVGPGDDYLTDVLPGVLLLGVGLTALVPTLTASVMASAPPNLAGIASGVNNGVARSAGLIAVAALPAVAGLAGTAYTDADQLTPAYRTAMLICAGLLVIGGMLAVALLPGRVSPPPAPREPSERREPDEAESTTTAAPCTCPGSAPSYGR